ncbi:cytochrome b/b6 domain-containing protein [Rhodobacter ferrooxidans]|uniref:Cytochrome B561 n=1 Tax=Rhodobacter ferrooxidans TaxID=371731 RepID=C8RYJ2_9RHOB|nr:cytochrome b/b6 domain-containing protein [Rhodobacter sp. SW2]EEW26180.1 cytochrome B561 [Rhodobacter sp. SW2]
MTSPILPSEPVETVVLWDPLLRVFHWALAISVAAAWGLGRFGPDQMTLHFWFGYAVIGLLAFRVLWGLFGPRRARFSSFIYGPRAVLAYLRKMGARKPSYWPGHNPMGGLFVIGLLAVLLAQVATGLIADPEDYINAGPLAGLVGTDTARTALGLHDILGNLLAAMVLLHVAVIYFYRLWKHEDLIRPMLTGRKAVLKKG